MMKFVLSQEFKRLNIGFALDEGLASPDETVPVFYGERNVFWVKFHCKGESEQRGTRLGASAVQNFLSPGNPGHGSRFIEGTAAEKVQYLINKLLAYRETQRKLLEASETYTLGDVTTCNLTWMSGGVQLNVVPEQFTVGFDLRITPTTDVAQFEAMIRKWCEEVS